MALDLNHTARADSRRVYTPQVTVDCSEISVPTDGKVTVMTIPSGFEAKEVYTEVLTAEGSTCTADIGDSSGSTTFGSGIDMNTGGNTNLDTSGGSSNPYTSDDYIQFAFSSTTQPGTLKFRVTAVFYDLGPQ